MRTMTLAVITLSVTIGLGTTAEPVWSQDEEDNFEELIKEAKVPIGQAIKTALDQVKGTVVEVEADLDKEKGKTVWEIEAVNADGMVTEVHVDAGNGRVISTQQRQEDD